MKKQNVVLIYSIYFPDYGYRAPSHPQLGVNFFVEKEKSFKPLFASYHMFKNVHNIMCRLNKSDEYLPLWKGMLMYGRDKEKLLRVWEEHHRVNFKNDEESFKKDEENIKEIIKECNNNPHPEVYYNILKAQMMGEAPYIPD